MAKLNPFDYVKAINEKKEMEHVRDYNPYLTNRALSYHLDTVMIANEMNKNHRLPPECQFDFLYHTVRKGRRFGGWYKEEENPHLEMVMEYYNYSKQKALAALKVLTRSDLKQIAEKMDTGGN